MRMLKIRYLSKHLCQIGAGVSHENHVKEERKYDFQNFDLLTFFDSHQRLSRKDKTAKNSNNKQIYPHIDRLAKIHARKSHLEYVCLDIKKSWLWLLFLRCIFSSNKLTNVSKYVSCARKGTFSSHEDGGDDKRRTFYGTEGKNR